MNVSMIRFKEQSRRGHGPGGRTAGSSVRTCLSLHSDEAESDSLPAHDEQLRTSAHRTRTITWTFHSVWTSAHPFLYQLCLPTWHS